MTMHTVKQGECLSSIARRYGFARWQTIYDDPQNAELKAKRPNPNTLAPGDVLYIPEKKGKNEGAATGKTHQFTRQEELTRLRLVLKHPDGKARAGHRYRLKVGATVVEGKSADNGLIEQRIPGDAATAELTIFFDGGGEGTWKLRLGALDPIDKPSGVRSRLCNLGYACGTEESMKEALKAFQKAQGLEVTGEADEATRKRLLEAHDVLN